MRITFWQNMPSHHMAPVQRALAELPGVTVRVIVQSGISQSRLSLGWSEPDFGRAEKISLETSDQSLIEMAQASNQVNLIGGLGGEFHDTVLRNIPRTADTLTALLLERGIYLGGFKDKLRPFYHRALLSLRKSKIDAVFAFGSLGVSYYRSLGIEQAKLYGYQYTCNTRPQLDEPSISSSLRLIYTGSFNYRKGFDFVPDALLPLKHYPWKLTLVGSGPLEASAKDLFDQYGLGDRVQWKGSVPSSEMFASTTKMTFA